MSGLYNLINGYNQLAGYLLGQLELQPQNCGRFRDACIYENPEKKGDYWIRILTRNGNGNRESYQEAIETMQKHPAYIKDEDDTYDSTYAYFYFKLPENVPMELEMNEITMEMVVDNQTLKEKTDATLAAMKKE